MTRVRFIVALFALVALAVDVRAAVANAVPPVGWSQVGTQGWLNVPAANASVMNGRAVANVTVNVGGRAVTMPASMRLAANAGQVAMNAVRLNPGVLAASVAASFMLTYGLEYAQGQGWLAWDEQTVPGYLYKNPFQALYTQDRIAVADHWFTALAGQQGVIHDNNAVCGAGGLQHYQCTGTYHHQCAGAPSGTYGCQSPWGTRNLEVQSGMVTESYQRPAVDADFFVPPGDPVPDELPGVVPAPLPVELPIINPDTSPVPLPLPMRVPEGAPVPVPGADPAEWRQPIIDIVPWNIPAEPWRVDLRPGSLLWPTPLGLDEPESVGGGSPAAGAGEGEQRTDCDKYPLASGCVPLGSVPLEEEIPNSDRPLSITPVSGFGPSSAACPPPRTITLSNGFSLSLPFGLLCQYADGIRPIVVALAWLSAALTFVGFGRKE